MPSTTAVFRAVGDFVALNKSVRETRNEMKLLQERAEKTGAFSKLDGALSQIAVRQGELQKSNADLRDSQKLLAASQQLTAKSAIDLKNAQKEATVGQTGYRQSVVATTEAVRNLHTAQKNAKTSAEGSSSAYTKVGNALDQLTPKLQAFVSTESQAATASKIHNQALLQERDTINSKQLAVIRLTRELTRLANAENAVAAASHSHVNALNRERAASTGVADSNNRLGDETSAAAAAARQAAGDHDAFAGSLRRLDPAARSAGSSIRGVAGHVDGFSSASDRTLRRGSALRMMLMSLIIPAVTTSLQALIGALASLGAGLIAVVGSAGNAAGAIAALGPAAGAAAAAVGTIALAFRGVGAALKAQTALGKQAASSDATSAKTRRDAARSILDAQEQLVRAQRDQARAAQDAARMVRDADRSVVDSHEDVLDAMQEVAEARREAIRDLQDMQDAAAGAALSERRASLSLERAQQRLAQVNADATSSSLDRREAALDVEEAQLRLTESTRANARASQDNAEAQAAGVNGSRQVVTATERLTDARRAEADAEEAAALARQDAADRQIDAADAVVKAQRAIAVAMENSQDATNKSTAAMSNAIDTMNKLSPAGQKFVLYLQSLMPLMDKLSGAAQTALFPGLTQALQIVMPMIESVAIPVVSAFGKVLGDLAVRGGEMLVKFTDDFLYFGTSMSGGLGLTDKFGTALINLTDALINLSMAALPLAHWLADLLVQFSEWAKETTEVRRSTGQLETYFLRVRDTLQLLGEIVGNLGGIFSSMFRAASPMGRRLLISFEQMTEETDKMLKTTEGFAKLRKYFDDTEPSLRITLDLLKGIFFWFAKLGASPTTRRFLEDIKTELVPALNRLSDAFGPLGGDLGAEFIDLMVNLSDAITAFIESDAANFFLGFMKTLGMLLDTFAAILRLPGVGDLAGLLLAIAGGFMAFKAVGKITGLNKVASAIRNTSAVAAGQREAAAAGRAVTPAAGPRTLTGGILAGARGVHTQTLAQAGQTGTRPATLLGRAGERIGRGSSAAAMGAAAYGAGRTPTRGLPTPFVPPGPTPTQAARQRRAAARERAVLNAQRAADRNAARGGSFQDRRAAARAQAQRAAASASAGTSPIAGGRPASGGQVTRTTGRVTLNSSGPVTMNTRNAPMPARGSNVPPGPTTGRTSAVPSGPAGGRAGVAPTPPATAAGRAAAAGGSAAQRRAAAAGPVAGRDVHGRPLPPHAGGDDRRRFGRGPGTPGAPAPAGAMRRGMSGLGRGVGGVGGAAGQGAAMAGGMIGGGILGEKLGGQTGMMVGSMAGMMAGPALMDAIGKGAKAAGGNIKKLAKSIGPMAKALRMAAAAQWALNGAMIANPIGLVVLAVVALGVAFFVAWKKSETFRDIVKGTWQVIQDAAMYAWENILKPTFAALVDAFKATGDAAMWLWNNAIKPAFDALTTALGFVMDHWKVFAAVLIALTAPISVPIIALVLAFTKFRDVTVAVFRVVWSVISPIIGFMIDYFKTLGNITLWLWQQIFMVAWNGIKLAVQVAQVAIGTYIDAVKLYFRLLGDAAMFLWNYAIKPAWDGIMLVIDAARAAIGIYIDAVKLYFQVLGEAAQLLWDGMKLVWEGIGAVISGTWSGVIEPAFGFLKAGLDGVRTFMEETVRKMGEVWGGLVGILKGPIDFFIDVVYEQGIRKAWNAIDQFIPGLGELPSVRGSSGGDSAGYTHATDVAYRASGGWIPGTGNKDSVPAMLMPGEFVVRKGVAQKHSSFLEWFNQGGMGFSHGGPVPHFAVGGPVGDVIGGAAGWVRDKFSSVFNLVGQMSAKFGNTPYVSIFPKMVTRVVDAVVDFAKDKILSIPGQVLDAAGNVIGGVGSGVGDVVGGIFGAKGGFLAGTHDRGGLLKNNSIAVNRSGRDEYVLNPQQWRAFQDGGLVTPGSGMGQSLMQTLPAALAGDSTAAMKIAELTAKTKELVNTGLAPLAAQVNSQTIPALRDLATKAGLDSVAAIQQLAAQLPPLTLGMQVSSEAMRNQWLQNALTTFQTSEQMRGQWFQNTTAVQQAQLQQTGHFNQLNANLGVAAGGMRGTLTGLEQHSNASWTTMRSVTDQNVNAITGPIFGGLNAGMHTVETVATGMATVWGQQLLTMQSKAADPVRWTMLNPLGDFGIAASYNELAKQFALGPPIVMPKPVGFALGGKVPGQGNGDTVPAWLTPGEYVIPKDVVRKWGLHNIHAAHLATKSGRFRGLEGMFGSDVEKFQEAQKYATGGLVADTGSALNAALQRAHDFARTNAGKRYLWGGTGPGGWDCSGWISSITHALRGENPIGRRLGTTSTFPWPGFQPGLVGGWAVGNVRGAPGHMAGTLGSPTGSGPGTNVESGGAHDTNAYGGPAKGADHPSFPMKFHLPSVGGTFTGGGGGGFVDPGPIVEAAFKRTYDMVADITRFFGGSNFVNTVQGTARGSVDRTKAKVLEKVGAKLASVGGGMDVSGINGDTVAQVRQVAARYGWDQGAEWDAIFKLVQKESSWNPNAANPTSSARGLFQKMTSIHGPVEPTAAGQAAWGLNYIKGRYGTPSAAWAFHQANNYYRKGGAVGPDGAPAFALGGLAPFFDNDPTTGFQFPVTGPDGPMRRGNRGRHIGLLRRWWRLRSGSGFDGSMASVWNRIQDFAGERFGGSIPSWVYDLTESIANRFRSPAAADSAAITFDESWGELVSKMKGAPLNTELQQFFNDHPGVTQGVLNTFAGNPLSALNIPWDRIQAFINELNQLKSQVPPDILNGLPDLLRQHGTNFGAILQAIQSRLPADLVDRVRAAIDRLQGGTGEGVPGSGEPGAVPPITDFKSYMASVAKTAAEQQQFEGYLLRIAQWGYDDLAKHLAQKGPGGGTTEGEPSGLELARQAASNQSNAAAAEAILEKSAKNLGDRLESVLTVIAQLQKSPGQGVREVSRATQLDPAEILSAMDHPTARAELAKMQPTFVEKFLQNLEAFKRGVPFAKGGKVFGTGSGDTVPAWLTPGEFVMRKQAVQKIGVNNLERWNLARGGEVLHAADFFSPFDLPRVPKVQMPAAALHGLSKAYSSGQTSDKSKSVVFSEGSVQINNPAPIRPTDSFEKTVQKLSFAGVL